MSVLTAKEESFCKCIADGMTNSDAYRASYNASGSTPKSVNELSSRLIAKIKIKARIKELKDALNNKHLWSRVDSVEVLSTIARDSVSRSSEKVAAVKELNNMHGYNEPQKFDITSSDGSMSPPTRIELVAPDVD